MENFPVYFEYTSAAVPSMSKLKPLTLGPGEPAVISTPALDVKYIKLSNISSMQLDEFASSSVFYVIKGSGTVGDDKTFSLTWEEGDVFTVPFKKDRVWFTASLEDAILFYANDSPLLKFLNAKPNGERFKPMVYKNIDMLKEIEKFNLEEMAKERNRNGILLSNTQMVEEGQNTLTHTMWSLLNSIGPNVVQKPHRHNSVAIDLCVGISQEAEEKEQVYTLMGEKLDDKNQIINPMKMVWKKNCTFTTPPGWWHSHYNESESEAWVFPVQDAGLHTYLRTLDIRFV
jgi:gentisate 1,2-dioxygenase